MRKCDWSPISKYVVVVVTVICHISAKAFLNQQSGVEKLIYINFSIYSYITNILMESTQNQSVSLILKTLESQKWGGWKLVNVCRYGWKLHFCPFIIVLEMGLVKCGIHQKLKIKKTFIPQKSEKNIIIFK